MVRLAAIALAGAVTALSVALEYRLCRRAGAPDLSPKPVSFADLRSWFIAGTIVGISAGVLAWYLLRDVTVIPAWFRIALAVALALGIPGAAARLGSSRIRSRTSH